MPSVPPAELLKLQSNTKNIRNVCILAHVDHGKTTLSDSLISSNGIISAKLAGKIRYMDSLPEEQERGITMKSSAISLLYKHRANSQNPEGTPYLINLIDSPGHVDFSSEVSTAVRITDGAFVLVDVLEGVCIQTQTVIRQAYNEKVRPCLVLNKIDRLISELKLSAEDAYHHIRKVLEQVNGLTGLLFKEHLLNMGGGVAAAPVEASTVSEGEVLLETESGEAKADAEAEGEIFFSPERGNVVFASAIDGWAFGIGHFAELYAKKLGVKPQLLQRTLWGEFYFSPKAKRIYTKPRGDLQPMFVQFCLRNIWEVYTAVNTGNWEKINKIVSALQLNVQFKESQKKDTRSVLNAIMSAWLPLADAVLSMCVQHMPSPVEAAPLRLPTLWRPLPPDSPQSLQQVHTTLKSHLMVCDPSPAADAVIFVSKVFSASRDNIVLPRKVPARRDPTAAAAAASTSSAAAPTPAPAAIVMPVVETAAEPAAKEILVGLARVFSGRIRRGMRVHVLGPRYVPTRPEEFRTEMEIQELYLLMGRALEPVEEVQAGNVFGIGGFGDRILKTATICTNPLCPTFSVLHFSVAPIVRVSVEPRDPKEMPKLIAGLQLLNQADPCVEVRTQDTGEHVVMAAGELHLERCVRDLKERFAKIELVVSPALVAFRETITADLSQRANGKEDFETLTPNKQVRLRVRATPLPAPVRELLDASTETIRRAFVENAEDSATASVAEFSSDLQKRMTAAGGSWASELRWLWAFGPRRVGSNMLFNHVEGFREAAAFWTSLASKLGIGPAPPLTAAAAAPSAAPAPSAPIAVPAIVREESIATSAGSPSTHGSGATADIAVMPSAGDMLQELSANGAGEDRLKMLRALTPSIVAGFQLATANGPLCEEPMTGLAFFIEEISIEEAVGGDKHSSGPIGGQVISAMKEACRGAFLAKSPRLVEAMFLCEVQVAADAMGKVYPVLARRRAQVLRETVKDGTSLFSIQAYLPVVESFGFSEEMMKKTSGAAVPQLMFSHWEPLDQDPFFVPTEEELEEFGENEQAMGNNVARRLIEDVRKRKGLLLEKKLIEHADKQRTLKKNK